MKVILYMAMSANGIIAGPNNEEDFLSHYNWEVLCDLAKKHGSFIWGRKTYEIVQDWEEEYMTEEMAKAVKVVVSRNKSLKLAKGYVLANSPQQAIKILASKGFKSTVLTGGARVNSSFGKAGLIDEVLLNVEAVFVGRGIPLFHPEDFEIKLKLKDIQRKQNNIVQLRYEVEK